MTNADRIENLRSLKSCFYLDIPFLGLDFFLSLTYQKSRVFWLQRTIVQASLREFSVILYPAKSNLSRNLLIPSVLQISTSQDVDSDAFNHCITLHIVF